MNATTLPFLALVLGGVVYQLALKRVPADTNPFAVLAAVYTVAAVACLGLMSTVEPRPAWSAARTGAVLGIAAGVLLIEGGFLFGYRAGLKLGAFSLAALSVTSAILLVVGLVAFGERLSAREWAGVVLCVAGAVLVKTGGER